MPFISASVISPYNSIRGGAEGGLVPVSLLLDLYPGAAAAYSLRKLSAAYTGAAIEVRKTVGVTTFIQDIGFVDNELDTASLLTFADGGDVFVAKWYDQSGNIKDALQISDANQPTIVEGGVLNLLNSKPNIKLNTTKYLGIDIETIANYYIFNVLEIKPASNVTVMYGSSFSSDYYWAALSGSTSTSVINNATQNDLFINGVSNTPTTRGEQYLLTDSQVIHTADINFSFLSPSDFTLGYVAGSGERSYKTQEVIIYSTDQTANRAGIESNINKNYNIYWDGSQTGLLDDYPNASAAYSLRALNSGYLGAAIRVRRSSDNAEQDIRFLYDGSLYITSLLNFVGAGDGFVSTWYDQSGAGNDAAQISHSSQPQIVSSGSVINENGKISVKFNGTTDYIKNQLSVGPTVTAFAVSKIVDEFDFNFIYDSFGTGGRIRLGLRNVKEYFADNGEASFAEATTPSDGNQHLFFAKHTNSDVSISVNQDTLQTIASTNFYETTQHWNIGARNDGADHFLDGTIQELILYPSDQTANRAGIESNINSNYKIYWDGSQTGLLDDYPNAAAAYSLRALNSAYTGPAIEARKTVAGETFIQDIGFLYDGSLDTASLLTFADGGDVFVAKWYDQSGEGNDALQVSDANQPRIVYLGVIDTINNKPALYSDGTKVLQTISTNISVADEVGNKSAFGTLKISNDNAILVSYIDGGANILYPIGKFDSIGGLAINASNGFVDSVPYISNTNSIFSSIVSNSNVEIWNNNVSNGSLARGVITLGGTQISLFARNNSGLRMTGYSNEIILYPSDQSANREAIETNINNYHNIY